jgi:hypothetical protein
MKISHKTLIFLFTISFGLNCTGQNLIKSDSDKIDNKYPWNQETTEKAIKAIEFSILNLKLPKNQRNKNFPANPGPYNVPFSQTEIVEFEIIGYSHSEKEPEIYQIEFRPAETNESGNRITVEINIKTNIAKRVFMQADS